MIRLYLVRHGETKLNKSNCYYGWTDCELSDRGMEQALILRHTFKDIKIDGAVSSDLRRAADTAEIICSGRDVQIERDDRLRELNFGAWEGRHYTEIEQHYRDNWESWIRDWQNTAPFQGESFAEMYSRIRSFIDELLNSCGDKDLLIVSHQGALRIIITYLLGMPAESIWSFCFEQGAYSVLELQDKFCVLRAVNK